MEQKRSANAANIARFDGFAGDYDRYRPAPPRLIADMLMRYLGRKARVLADLGCGTGLSTRLWCGRVPLIHGVEPNTDMLSAARSAGGVGISYHQAASDATGLAQGSVDIVTCSQAFHWMEPTATLAEVGRILAPGGVFAAYDCDWPPALGVGLEQAWDGLIFAADKLAERVVSAGETVRKWPKSRHLENMRASGRFCHTSEFVCHAQCAMTAEHFTGLAYSQGALQTVLRAAAQGQLPTDSLASELQAFHGAVQSVFGTTGRRRVLFGYRVRVGKVPG